MDIAQAKQELRRTIRAYTAKTEDGVYRMPRRMQRPVLLMGPPGIGKTAILSPAGAGGARWPRCLHHDAPHAPERARPARHCGPHGGREDLPRHGIHHERDHRLRLRADGEDRPARGILFLDEINCVSETLMPAILQMLQNKTFGVHSLPEGWLIVAAGNPPRYNQSARKLRHGDARPRALHRARAESCCLAALCCRQRRASGRAELSAAAPGALFSSAARAPRQGSSPRPAAGRSFLRFCSPTRRWAIPARLRRCSNICTRRRRLPASPRFTSCSGAMPRSFRSKKF